MRMNVRKVEKTVLSVEQAEGVGARVRRSIGRKEVSSSTTHCSTVKVFNEHTHGNYHSSNLHFFLLHIFHCQLRNLDPFLMLDEFRVSKPAGFPDHPHRGFETVRICSTEFKASCGECCEHYLFFLVLQYVINT